MSTVLINEVRSMTGATTTDATDADIVRELERCRQMIEAPMSWEAEYVGGTPAWSYQLGYIRPWGVVSPGTAGQTNGGTLPVGTLRTALGAAVTGWTIDEDGYIAFAAAGSVGSAYTFRGYGYDLNRAAARLLTEMAASEARQFDVDVSGDKATRSQKYQNLLDLSKHYAKKARPTTRRLVRSDES